MREAGRVPAVPIALVVAVSAGPVAAQERPDWVAETPGGDTTCAFDTPYRFFHAGLGEGRDLLIWFQGGGACWEWVSCSGMFDSEVERSELADYGGVFDRADERNPLREFAILFVPYCTGDVHVGDVETRYGDDPSARPVRHRGYRNALAAIDFIDGRAGRPARVVVSGASAGSYGAIFWMPEIARRFPEAERVLIGDSGIPLLEGYPDILRAWGAGAALSDLRGEDVADDAALSLVRAHEAAAAAADRVAQVTSDRDDVQSAFYLISGSPEWRSRTYALLDSIAARLPGFRSYVAPGSDHGLLRTDAFYAYESSGVPLHEWVADVIAGETVGNVRCVMCSR